MKLLLLIVAMCVFVVLGLSAFGHQKPQNYEVLSAPQVQLAVEDEFLAIPTDNSLDLSDPRYLPSARPPEGYEDLSARAREQGGSLDDGADACPATVIPTVPFVEAGTTASAANDYTTACGSGSGRDVIFSITPTLTVLYKISTCQSTFNTVLSLRSGGSCPGASELRCQDNFCGLQAQMTITLSRNNTRYFVLDGAGTQDFGNYTIVFEDSVQCPVVQQPGDLGECGESQNFEHDSADCDGGCNNLQGGGSPLFATLNNGQTACGRIFTYPLRNGSQNRDTDWYTVTLTEPCSVRVAVTTELECNVWLLPAGCPSSNQTLIGAALSPCATHQLTTPCMDGGQYYLVIAPNTFSGYRSFHDYRMTFNAIPCGQVGRCCYGPANDPTCAYVNQNVCTGLGGSWIAHTHCEDSSCYVRPVCLPSSEFSQLPLVPGELWDAYPLETDDLRMAESFSGLTRVISQVRIWAISTSDSAGVNCLDDPQTLSVRFYQNSPSNTPGALACSTNVSLSATSTGYLYHLNGQSYPLLQYDISVSPWCNLTQGWISIIALTNSNCNLKWLRAVDRDQLHKVSADGSSWNDAIGDLAFCFGTSANDDCPGFVIPSLPFTDSGNLCDAPVDFQSCFTSNHDLMYQLTVPCAMDVNVSLCNSPTDWNSFLAIRRSGACPGSTVVICQDGGCPAGSSHAAYTITALPDTPYYFNVRGRNLNDCGNYVLNVTAASLCPPDSVVIQVLDTQGMLQLNWTPVYAASTYSIYAGDSVNFPTDPLHRIFDNVQGTELQFAIPPNSRLYYRVTGNL